MKKYIAPEIEGLNQQSANIMLDLPLGSSDTELDMTE